MTHGDMSLREVAGQGRKPCTSSPLRLVQLRVSRFPHAHCNCVSVLQGAVAFPLSALFVALPPSPPFRLPHPTSCLCPLEGAAAKAPATLRCYRIITPFSIHTSAGRAAGERHAHQPQIPAGKSEERRRWQLCDRSRGSFSLFFFSVWWLDASV